MMPKYCSNDWPGIYVSTSWTWGVNLKGLSLQSPKGREISFQELSLRLPKGRCHIDAAWSPAAPAPPYCSTIIVNNDKWRIIVNNCWTFWIVLAERIQAQEGTVRQFISVPGSCISFPWNYILFKCSALIINALAMLRSCWLPLNYESPWWVRLQVSILWRFLVWR